MLGEDIPKNTGAGDAISKGIIRGYVLFFYYFINLAFARLTSLISRLGGFNIKDGISETKKSLNGWLMDSISLEERKAVVFCSALLPVCGSTSKSINYLFS